MAKNEIKSSSSKNNSNKNSIKNSSNTHKNIFIICAAIVIVLFVALWIFSLKEQKLPTTPIQTTQGTQTTQLQPEQDQAQKEEELVGMAIKGYVEPNPNTASAPQGYAVINPQVGTAYLDSADTNNDNNPDQIPFTVEVEAYPYVPGLTLNEDMKKVNHFEITLKYDSTKFEYKSAKVLVSGSWDAPPVSPIDIGQPYKQITFEALGKDPTTTYPYDSATTLAEFTFAPLTSKGTGIIQLANIDILNSLSNGDYIDIITVHSQQYDKATITLNMKMYADVDGDDYGDPSTSYYYSFTTGDSLPTVQGKKLVANDGDCNDDKTKDPIIAFFSCPTTTSGCMFINPDSLEKTDPEYIAKYYYPECAICQHPSVPIEICDGIDNDCNGNTDDTPDGTPPTCTVKGYECGVFYTCKGSHQLDCNNEGVVFSGKYAGHEKCAATDIVDFYCDVSTGKCVTTLGEVTVCPGCEDVELKLGNCFESFPCVVADCAANGGTCSGSQCIITGTCKDIGETISYTSTSGDTTIYSKKGCVDSNLIFASCQDASTLILDKATCKTGCDLAQGGCIDGEVSFECFTPPPGMTAPCEKFVPVDEATPGCGNDICNKFENYKTCPNDCVQANICNPEQGGVLDYCTGDDTDKDGLPNAYEVYLNTNAGKTWFDVNKADTDGDSIDDDADYCPDTDTKGGQATAKTGRVNALGCYAADVGSGNEKSVRPDGCFSGFDTTYYISYYTNLMQQPQPTCTNLYGQTVTS